MRILTLIRHAKSSWAQEGLDDFERPLNERGRRDAPVMAARFSNEIGRPDLLLSSPALRAITTARVFANVLDIAADGIELQSRIYDATPVTLMEIVRQLDDRHRHVALFGHNPGFSELSHQLASCDFDELPTCGIAHISLTIERWQNASRGCGRLLYKTWPKDDRNY